MNSNRHQCSHPACRAMCITNPNSVPLATTNPSHTPRGPLVTIGLFHLLPVAQIASPPPDGCCPQRVSHPFHHLFQHHQIQMPHPHGLLRLECEHALHHTSPFPPASFFIHPDTTYSDTSPPWLLQFRPPVMCTPTPFGQRHNHKHEHQHEHHHPSLSHQCQLTHPSSAFFHLSALSAFTSCEALTASVMDYRQYPLLRLSLSYSLFSFRQHLVF